MFRILITLVMICTYASSQNCLKTLQATESKKLQLVQTGQFLIKATDFSSRQNWYRVNFKQDYQGSIPSVGLSILYIKGYSDSSGVDFLIRPSTAKTYFDAVFTISVKALWVQAHFHYIASSQPEIVTGIADITHPSLIDPVPDRVNFQVQVPVKVSSSRYRAFAVLAGLKSEEATFNLILNQDLVRITKNNLIVFFTLQKKSKAIELLSISYFAIQSNSKYSLTSSWSAPSDFFRNPQNLKSFATNSNGQTTASDYTIAGTIAYYGQNISKNKADPIKNLRDAVLEFQSNSQPTTRMLRIAGNGNSARSAVGSVGRGAGASIGAGAGGSALLSGAGANSKNKADFQKMSDEQKRVFYLKMIKDSPPEVPSDFNQYTEVDAPWLESFKNVFDVRGFGEIVLNNYLPPMFLKSSISDQVPTNLASIIEKNVCVNSVSCTDNGGKIFTLRDGTVSCAFCAENKVFSTQNQTCQCKQGYTKSGQGCKEVKPLCDDYSIYLNGACFRLKRTAKMCQKNQVFSSKQNRCRCQENFNEKLSPGGSLVCVPACPAGSFYNPVTSQCICPGNGYYQKGKCIQCKSQSQWDPSKKQCVCLPNSRKAENGECQPCSPYARFDPIQNACICYPGFEGNGNICIRSLFL